MASVTRLSSAFLRPVRNQLSPITRYGFTTQKAKLSMFKKPSFENEPSPEYETGSVDRAKLTRAIESLKQSLPVRVPLVVAGQTVKDSSTMKQLNPSRHNQVIAEWTPANKEHVKQAIDAALAAKPAWEDMAFESRAAIWLRAAELVAGKYRHEMIAATMLGQGKTIWQAEIDVAAEAADLLRFQVQCAMDLFAQQPTVNPAGMWNRMEYRALEGFVYAVSPFNFTALGAQLAGGPALLGNVVLWKPSDYALHSSWLLHKILLEAGLPPNVIQFIPGNAEEITQAVFDSPHFAALNFIGSTKVFKNLWGKIGKATSEDKYLSYPRVVGETGGKNFHLVHGSADVENAVNNTIRGAFEYQGQKCSASSRVYVAESIWPAFKKNLLEKTQSIKVGNPENFENYVNAVIHEAAFDKLASVIEKANSDPHLTLLAGGSASKEEGYFVQPTIYQTSDPRHDIMAQEYFGPMFGVYVFPDSEWATIPRLIDTTSKYGLTGSVFARDQTAITFAEKELRHSAGNFYINCKSTASVVAQQPFGGTRGSGTNDKVGSATAMSRFVSVRSIKEDFIGTKEFDYPSNKV